MSPIKQELAEENENLGWKTPFFAAEVATTISSHPTSIVQSTPVSLSTPVTTNVSNKWLYPTTSDLPDETIFFICLGIFAGVVAVILLISCIVCTVRRYRPNRNDRTCRSVGSDSDIDNDMTARSMGESDGSDRTCKSVKTPTRTKTSPPKAEPEMSKSLVSNATPEDAMPIFKVRDFKWRGMVSLEVVDELPLEPPLPEEEVAEAEFPLTFDLSQNEAWGIDQTRLLTRRA